MPVDLPVRHVLDDVLAALARRGRAVLEAPPGAGKTTLVPPALADRVAGRVVVLEPRRIAARAAAQRMAALAGEPVGGLIGFTTADERRASARTRVEVVTEGVLVRRLQRDPSLEGIGAVVVDEFHERSLEADLALAFTLDAAAALRDDLAILVMSATLEGARVADLLGAAPRIRSEGRVHPVATHHRPTPAGTAVEDAVARAVREALAAHDGDVLAFLPGAAEIRRCAAALADVAAEGVAVRALHGALSAAEQDAALAPGPGRRVVLATDLAETSLTVPGVRVVVDSGLARRPRFDPRTGMSGLVTVRISADRAEQRRGRAGREAPGVCYRLWSAAEDGALAPQRPPAVAEADLAGFALELAAWGTPDPVALPLLDQPPPAAFAQARALLEDLGAVDAAGRITAHGRLLADLPVHPRLAHMIAVAVPGDRRLACEVAAVLADRDPLVVPPGTRHADLETRVAVLRGARPPAGITLRRGALQRARRELRRLLRSVDRPAAQEGPIDRVGVVLAAAYPDRVAQRRDRPGAFVLAGGRGAVLPADDPLAGEALLVVAALDRGGQEARIHLAAALDVEEVGHLVRRRAVVAWEDGDVVAEEREELGRLVLRSRPLADPDPAAVTAALLEGVAREGLALLPWDPATRRLRARLAHLHRTRAGEGWPDVGDDALLEGLPGWLGPYLAGRRRRADLAGVPLADALRGLVPPALLGRLDELAPTHVRVPSGSRVAVDYGGERPVLAVKLQELFGLTRTPEVAGRPLLLHLLSPAGRPVQVTDDLASFWAHGYRQVRAELRGRYPKHPWPEDPLRASPTAGTTRRRPSSP